MAESVIVPAAAVQPETPRPGRIRRARASRQAGIRAREGRRAQGCELWASRGARFPPTRVRGAPSRSTSSLRRRKRWRRGRLRAPRLQPRFGNREAKGRKRAFVSLEQVRLWAATPRLWARGETEAVSRGGYFLEEASVSRSLLCTRPRSQASAVSVARQGQRAGRPRGPARPPGDSGPVATPATLKMLRHRRSPCFTSRTFSKTLCEAAENEADSQVPLRSEFCATSGVRDPFQPSLIFTFLIIISHCHGACYFWKEGTGRWSLNDNKSQFK